MDPDVARLVREQRLLDAARLASDRGDARSASEIFERACEWRSAAAEAIRAGDASRALELAVCAGDDGIASRALTLVGDPATAQKVAARLADQKQYAWAARLLEGCGRQVDAARLWEREGDAPRAAALLESAGEAHEAARVLHDAIKRDPEAWAVAVALGTMLARLGKWEAAVRWLQRVPTNAPERSNALAPLARALEKLGLAGAAREATTELAQLIGTPPAVAVAEGRPSAHRSTAGTATPAPAEHRPRAREVPPVEPPGGERCIFGHYVVVRQVASSPSARLLECRDTVRGERVAVKVFAACEATGGGRDALVRFEREARAMKSLQHPCVVPIRDFIPHGPALVLAWMNGGTLDRMQSELGPLGPSRAVEIASAVLSALEAGHRLGIVHRDVKPTNVLFDDNGGARLGDFGVAHLLDLSTTVTSDAFGAMAYMSPEQRGGRAVTAASDVYSVGVMLREMLTGERPDPDDPPRRLPSEVHRGLDARHDDAILGLTARDPMDRPGGASEARALLASLPWPNAADPRAVGRVHGDQDSPLTPAERVRLEPDGAVVDRWTERRIERVLLTEGSLARARAFALADHPALQTVWRVDEGAGTLWLEALEARGLGRPLTPDEHVRLRQALAALHAAGVAHGRVDSRHVVDGQAGVVLRFGAEYADATVEDDNAALDSL